MLNQLRLFREFNLDDYQVRTGLPISGVIEILQEAKNKGLVNLNGNIVALTSLGKRFLNDLMQMFLMEEVHK